MSSSDVKEIPIIGCNRINIPPDGGCQRGYCYACGKKIGALAAHEPTLPRGDTYWFCSSSCYARILRGYIPTYQRYPETFQDFCNGMEAIYGDNIHQDSVERIKKEVALEYVEWQKKQVEWTKQDQIHQREALPKLLADLQRIDEGKSLRRYEFPDPWGGWIPSHDPPVIRSIKQPRPDRCVHCGSADDTFAIYVHDTPFWFCSDHCSQDAIKEFMPKRCLSRPNEDQ